MFKKGRGLLGHRTAKSAASEEWYDELSWFVVFWNKFGKAKTKYNGYWVGVVKYGHGILDHGILKYFKNESLNRADF